MDCFLLLFFFRFFSKRNNHFKSLHSPKYSVLTCACIVIPHFYAIRCTNHKIYNFFIDLTIIFPLMKISPFSDVEIFSSPFFIIMCATSLVHMMIV